MKWALLFPNWKKFGEGWNSCDAIVNELLSRGHEVKEYNTYHAEGQILPQHTIRSYSNESINRLYQEYQHGYKPDVVMLLDYGCYDSVIFDKQYFLNSIIVAEFGDEPQSHRSHWPKASRIHLGLSPDWPCVLRYQQHGYNVAWWTQFADHRIFYPRDHVQPVWDLVSTAGGRAYTAEISRVLGNRFENSRYYYGNDHAIQLLKGKIVFQQSQHKECTRRIFESMACGRMVITDRLPEETRLQELFQDGEDVIYYDNAKDAIDKINYFVSHDEEREAIALNGYNKVMKEHTVARRIDELEKLIMGLKS